MVLQAVDGVVTYFKENPNAQVYFAIVEADGNAKVLQSVVLQGRKLGKSVYVFSSNAAEGKVAHVNFVAEDAKSRGLDGRAWATAVSEVVGGKAGGKEDGAQGVGADPSRTPEALAVAQKFYADKIGA